MHSRRRLSLNQISIYQIFNHYFTSYTSIYSILMFFLSPFVILLIRCFIILYGSECFSTIMQSLPFLIHTSIVVPLPPNKSITKSPFLVVIPKIHSNNFSGFFESLKSQPSPPSLYMFGTISV